MAMSQQLSGINAINYYSSSIFEAALPEQAVRKNEDLPKYMVAITGLVNMIVTTISVFTIDKLGRRASHLIGLMGMAICTMFVALLLSDLVTDPGQTCSGIGVGNGGLYVAIVFIFIYIAFFSLGPGAIPWLIAPELFTSGSRPKAMSIANTVNWLCNFAIAIGFSPLISELCGWVFMIFFILLSIFITYLYIRLPEVAGKSINQIVQMFADKGQKIFAEDETTPIITDTDFESDKSKNENARV